MSLIFHGHPLSSYCWKVLIALYENDTPFTFRQLVNLGDPAEREAFAALWPMAKMPVLEDRARGEVVAETTIVVDYLDAHYPGPVRFVPGDSERARDVRFRDRVYDLYVQGPMQKIVGDRLRPEGQKDPFGVAEARTLLATALAMVERQIADKGWAAGDDFTLADCAALPALYYADKVAPFGGAYPNASALLERLKARPSVARVLAEAAPYAHYFPSE
jgi:glutathione S-transferase